MGLVFIALSKAFDSVCHALLLEKHSRYGLRGGPHSAGSKTLQ